MDSHKLNYKQKKKVFGSHLMLYFQPNFEQCFFKLLLALKNGSNIKIQNIQHIGWTHVYSYITFCYDFINPDSLITGEMDCDQLDDLLQKFK